MSDHDSYDLVVLGGRVMDPESGMDAVGNVGVTGGKIEAITKAPMRGELTVDAAGLVVAPGFIDMHSHGQDAENYLIQAQDGVTTALELELGASDVDRWYDRREGKSPVNYGASVGHIPVRMEVIPDPGNMVPVADAANRAATEDEVARIMEAIDRGLDRGALAVGFGIAYTPAASRWEVLEAFRLAARHGATCHVHMRSRGFVEGLEEVIAASAITGASLHVVHISSTGLRSVPQLLQVIRESQSRGMDVTTECYPYTAGMTEIGAAMFSEDWQTALGIGYQDLEWAETGERLTAESFARYREENGFVILHMIPEEIVELAVTSPLTSIASDGIIRGGKGHPRTAGTYTKVLGYFVRELGALTLMEALRKMALMPALRVEGRAPAMRDKGRVRVGADADLVAFDPDRVADRATYAEPTLPPEGMEHVLVNGVPVVSGGNLNADATPGRAVRAPVA